MKFSVGEVVVYTGTGVITHGPHAGAMGPFRRGDLVTILSPSVSPIDGSTAYFLDAPDWPIEIRIREINLRKRPYKDQHTPAEQSFPELIEYLNKVTANQEESR